MRHKIGFKGSSFSARILVLLIVISDVILIISRIGAAIGEEVIFGVGLVEMLFGLMIVYDWLGEKPDYSQTSYVSKGDAIGLVFPYEKPKKKPEDARTVKKAKSRVNLIALAVILRRFLLIAISAIL